MAALRHAALALTALVLGAAPAAPAAAQDSLRLFEQDIKAGLIYNFMRYTEWPPARVGEPMVVCLYGGDPFGGRLQPMAGRTVNRRPIEVRGVSEDHELDACALLVINPQAREAWPHLRARLAQSSVLTVSDYDGFARSGGMLEFTRLNNRVSVRVNVGAAEAANLTVQDRLLRLASVVRTDTR